MRPLTVVKFKPLLKSFSQLSCVVKRPSVEIRIFERPPQALDDYIILDAATAIHADVHIVGLEQISEGAGGKLCPPLVVAKDFWR